MSDFIFLKNSNILKFDFPRIISYVLLYGIFGLFNFIYLKNYVLLAAIILFFILPFVSLLLLIKLSNSIYIELFQSDNSVNVGDNLSISIGIENTSHLSSLKLVCDILIQNSFYSEKCIQSVTVPVIAKEKNINPFNYSTNYSGLIQVSIEKAKLFDLLGLFYVEIKTSDISACTVLPALISLSDIQQYGIINSYTANEDDTKTGNEYSDTSNIRQYIPGDRLKDIHWKLSSKKNEILVKEHIKSCENKLLLWIDYSNIKKQNEQIIQLLYAICSYCISEGIFITLMWCNKSNDLSYHTIENKNELIDSINQLFISIKHDNNISIEELIISSDFNADKILRIGLNSSGVDLYTYEI